MSVMRNVDQRRCGHYSVISELIRSESDGYPVEKEEWMVQEELMRVAENCPVRKGTEPPDDRKSKTISRIKFEVLSENPYKFTEYEFFFHVHYVIRKKTNLKIQSYILQRVALARKWGWGIHRDGNGKLALVGCETDKYRQLADDPSVKKTKAWRAKDYGALLLCSTGE
jgi:hypothetical protein